MAETKTKNEALKPYKEKFEKNLYSTDYETISSNGNKFPSNRIKIDLISYNGETEYNGEIKAYEGQKIVITNSKLELQDGQVIIKSKSFNGRSVRDETKVKLGVSEFDDIIKHYTKKTTEETKKD